MSSPSAAVVPTAPSLSPIRRRGRLSLITALLLVAGVIAGVLALAAPARAATTAPRTPTGMPSAIEPMADYVAQTACDPVVGPGTRKLATYLAASYRATVATTWASVYNCGTDGMPSEHSDGRAIDWMVNVTNRTQRAVALATINWLLATDAQGNRFAMARRLGVMYLIWDNRMWGAWSGRWENYNGCQAASMQKAAYANSCHRTHIHISLSWNGAEGRTSFWTRKVSPQDYGPCRAADLNWAPLYSRPNYHRCAQYRAVTAAKGSSATKRGLLTWSGAWLGRRSHGPAVSAVQRAFHLPQSGNYTRATVTAVSSLQARNHLQVTGCMNQGTWRALLRSVR